MFKTETFQNIIKNKDDLRAILGAPRELAEKKVIDHLDKHCRNFISKSPFLLMATSNLKGKEDVSPRGDQPGFVHVLNEKQLVIPERKGNRRADSMLNILDNPNVGLLFLIPGMGETLRVNGKAVLVQDNHLLEKMAVEGNKPLIGIGVEVEECFIHCAKSTIRSGLWKPETWPEKDALPWAAQILADHAKICGQSAEEIDVSLKEGYKTRLY
ncbi:pyridoxamine 5'-phosphate oxidase family protein [Neobacillus sp. PS3-34]|uniref:pyridoxamine 5'-phosphate oxidase family protein n=1 Tax=Neobacillus sp. PS3-34 TaxID=3070678 RepID=UPI0027DEC61F|nr:pyridoxamine 5'-phosphate oxidase family protein [Neobacillus sp. PS3-34]WML48812.1 pyridoxamine 5'-phosphate oxidase family protein [Neobacillus sp. PS3-34]